MRDAREQMVFHLKIHATNQPAKCPIAAGEIHGSFQLMDRPWCVDPPAAFMWHWKSGLFHQVCHLEHECQQQASDGRSHCVKKHYRADRVKDQR